MSDFSAPLDAAYRKSVIHDFYAVEVVLPAKTIRLLDGAGFVSFSVDGVVQTFKGSDPVYGVLSAADAIKEGFGDNAPAFTFSIQPATDAATLALSDLANQGSRVRVWTGVLNPATNAVFGTSLRFDGLLDFAMIEGDLNSISIELQCITWAELYFLTQEGIALSDGFHKSLYPTETGFAYVTGIQRSIIWGPGDRPNNITYETSSTGAADYRGRSNENFFTR
ncbi:MAG: hypothetical protein U5K75_11010 [Ahrensia sp.]|nr:hypothetical protein [Ahrensia sp.]